jgi:hypothetical protein
MRSGSLSRKAQRVSGKKQFDVAPIVCKVKPSRRKTALFGGEPGGANR